MSTTDEPNPAPQELSAWPAAYIPERALAFRHVVALITEADRTRRQATESSLLSAKQRRLRRVGAEVDETLLRKAQALDSEAQATFDQMVFQCVAAAFLALQRGEALITDEGGPPRLLRVTKPAVPGVVERLVELARKAEAAEDPDPELEPPPMRVVTEDLDPTPTPEKSHCDRPDRYLGSDTEVLPSNGSGGLARNLPPADEP